MKKQSGLWIQSEMLGLYVSWDIDTVSSLFHTHSSFFCLESYLVLEEWSPNTTTIQTASLEYIGYLGNPITSGNSDVLGQMQIKYAI